MSYSIEQLEEMLASVMEVEAFSANVSAELERKRDDILSRIVDFVLESVIPRKNFCEDGLGFHIYYREHLRFFGMGVLYMLASDQSITSAPILVTMELDAEEMNVKRGLILFEQGRGKKVTKQMPAFGSSEEWFDPMAYAMLAWRYGAEKSSLGWAPIDLDKLREEAII